MYSAPNVELCWYNHILNCCRYNLMSTCSRYNLVLNRFKCIANAKVV